MIHNFPNHDDQYPQQHQDDHDEDHDDHLGVRSESLFLCQQL